MSAMPRLLHGVTAAAGRRLTYANVTSTLALVVALGTGSAYAANTISSSDIVDGQVKTADLARGAVTSPTIKDGEVGAADLRVGSVGTLKVGDGSLTGTDVADGSLTLADLRGADVTDGQISIAAGAVANGRCRQFAATAGGARAGEAVLLSAVGPVQDGVLLYGSRAPADDRVTVDVCNFSGSTLAAITNLPVRVVTLG